MLLTETPHPGEDDIVAEGAFEAGVQQGKFYVVIGYVGAGERRPGR